MSNLIKPNILKKWDTIWILSPSWPIAWMIPHRFENWISYLKKMWFKVKIAKNCLKVNWYTAGSIEERINDIHELFLDNNVKAIICTIWGFHSNQLLKYIDYSIIKNNPKIFIWFSDITVLHFAFYVKSNLCTYYWPALLTQFAEYPKMLSYTEKYFYKALLSNESIWKILPSQKWTDELLNWFQKKDLDRPRKMKKNNWYEFLKKWKAEWILLWWCITSILHLRGTEYWPNFKNTLFFWEIPESSCDLSKWEPISRIDTHLTDLELSWIFNKISWMIIWRPKWYTENDISLLKEIIYNKFINYNFPILFWIDIWHTDPIITLPIWIKWKIDSYNKSFEILESWTNW